MFGGVSHHFERFYQSWNELMLAFARNGKFKVQADFKSVFTFGAEKKQMYELGCFANISFPTPNISILG